MESHATPVFVGGLFFLAMLMGVVFGIVLTVIPWWKICGKAGFSPALSLLMLVPIANIILPFYVAFAQWPKVRELEGSVAPHSGDSGVH